jgi:hypothetical protein
MVNNYLSRKILRWFFAVTHVNAMLYMERLDFVGLAETFRSSIEAYRLQIDDSTESPCIS